MNTQSLIDAYNAKVAAMRPDPKCQHPEAGPAFRFIGVEAGDIRGDAWVGHDHTIRIWGTWRYNEGLLLFETARELQTMGLGEATVEVTAVAQ